MQNLLSIANSYEKKINSIEILDQYQVVRETLSLDGLNKLDVSPLPYEWYVLRCILNDQEIFTIPFINL